MGSQTPEPQLLEIPGAEGVSIEYLTNLLNQTITPQNVPQLNVGPAQNIPGLNVGPAQQIPGLNVGPAQNIPLQQIAGMTGNEQTTQDMLAKYLGTDATQGQAYKLGMGELTKTLGGDYDPTKSDFWEGYREHSAIEQEKGVSDIRRRGQLGGGLYATPNQRTESDYVRGAGADRQMMLGGLFEKERDRKSNAVNQALGYAGFEDQSMANKLQAGHTIGATPRNIQNQKNQATYNQQLGQSGADYSHQQQQNAATYNQQLGQSSADFAHQQAQNQSTYNQAFGQGQADFAQQQSGNAAVFNQAAGQGQADYAAQLAQIGIQSGAAGALMPQWNIPEASNSSGPLGLLGNIVSALPK